MIKKRTQRRDFISRNHTIFTGYRHKQKYATLILSNALDAKTLIAANVIVYMGQKRARLNYKGGKQGLPCIEKNLLNFFNEETSHTV